MKYDIPQKMRGELIQKADTQSDNPRSNDLSDEEILFLRGLSQKLMVGGSEWSEREVEWMGAEVSDFSDVYKKWGNGYWRAAKDLMVAFGEVRHVTEEELKHTTTTGGKKYWFQHKNKKYQAL